MAEENEGNKINDKSHERIYYTQAPRIVWAKCRSPYDYMMWCVVKDIAGENSECYLSTPDLAALAMMSTGKAQECRKYLISVGLLEGAIVKDPSYPQPVWHLSVPDLWPENVKWCSEHKKLKERVTFKKEHSCGVGEHSCGEKGTPPHEKGTPPGETKNNQVEEPKEKPVSAVDIKTAELKEVTGVPELTYVPRDEVEHGTAKKKLWEPRTELAKYLMANTDWPGFQTSKERNDWEAIEAKDRDGFMGSIKYALEDNPEMLKQRKFAARNITSGYNNHKKTTVKPQKINPARVDEDGTIYAFRGVKYADNFQYPEPPET